MKIISQTNRTLLLEEINPEKLDLLTMIGDVRGIDSLSDDKIKEINEALLCRSYEEFQEKFAPCIYSFYDANTQTVRYTLKKPESIPENMLTVIPLNQQNDFLKMLFSLMEAKKSQGVLNVDFGFEHLLDMISPKKVMEDIRQVRKEIRYNYSKYAALEEGDPARLDVGDKLNVLFESASDNYNNVLAMLPLAIEDIKTRLLLGAGDQGINPNQIALPFGGGLVLDIAMTVATICKLVADNVVVDVSVAMTFCQVLLFILFIALIWVHNRPDQMQYIVYAIAYFIVVVLEWANTATFNPLSPFGIDLDFSIPYFILPLKEAMLLYIILDVALQAIANKRNAGEKRHEE